MVVFSGWFLVTIVLPLTAPVIALLVFGLIPAPWPPPGPKVMTAVKDGQLGWAVIAMGASGLYEHEAHRSGPDWLEWANGGLMFVIASATIVAAGGAVFNTPLLTTTVGGVKAWAVHYQLFVASAVMTVVCAFLYTCIHFSTSQ